MQYLADPEHNPLQFAYYPMVKSSLMVMKAIEEFTLQEGIAEITGWVVTGGSKRGWTSWLVGSTNCTTCAKIVGIAPLVPITPNLVDAFKWQWMAYDAWTFAI